MVILYLNNAVIVKGAGGGEGSSPLPPKNKLIRLAALS